MVDEGVHAMAVFDIVCLILQEQRSRSSITATMSLCRQNFSTNAEEALNDQVRLRLRMWVWVWVWVGGC